MKKVLILGANGRISIHVEEKLSLKEDVTQTLLVRDEFKGEKKYDNAIIEKCDVLNTDKLAAIMEGQDIVVASLNGDLLSSAKSIVEAMKQANVKRILWVTGLGIHHEIPGEVGKMLDGLVAQFPEFVQAADVIADDELDYTLIRCPNLTDGSDTVYDITEIGEIPRKYDVTRQAVAEFIVDIIKEPKLAVRKSVGISN